MTGLDISADQFRAFGQVELCGILYVTYQSTHEIQGSWALCALLDEYLMIAFPNGNTGRFETVAVIQLSDMKFEAITDGKGMCTAGAGD